ncbi:LacI family DNA-binding transcriptional regulator [Microbacterium indicum]|uniref:LacI family DNA-binding transcriptional regulator n=1 Tax=Microbacterium indicum TaxID=358100 RepID=UPI000416A861|nr:LacI family DNA-binding transcriptional regulator [Microbacterium indicum]
MATLADVAALAGVSKATASRVFSRPDVVSQSTAERVHTAADKLGFVANRAARQLAGGRTGVIALTVPTLANSFFTPVIAGAQAAADEADLQLTVVVHPLEHVDELAKFARLAKQVDGAIVVAPRGIDDLVTSAIGRLPAVLVDREIDGVDSVRVDTPEAFGRLTDALIAAGHERLLYVGGPAGSWQDRLRESLVRAAADRAGVRVDVASPYESTFAAGIRASGEILRHRPTAVIPYATDIGLGIAHALLLAGEELPVITSETSIVDAVGSAAPAIDVDGEALGREAVEMLVARMADPGRAAAARVQEVQVTVPKRG